MIKITPVNKDNDINRVKFCEQYPNKQVSLKRLIDAINNTPKCFVFERVTFYSNILFNYFPESNTFNLSLFINTIKVDIDKINNFLTTLSYEKGSYTSLQITPGCKIIDENDDPENSYVTLMFAISI